MPQRVKTQEHVHQAQRQGEPRRRARRFEVFGDFVLEQRRIGELSLRHGFRTRRLRRSHHSSHEEVDPIVNGEGQFSRSISLEAAVPRSLSALW